MPARTRELHHEVIPAGADRLVEVRADRVVRHVLGGLEPFVQLEVDKPLPCAVPETAHLTGLPPPQGHHQHAQQQPTQACPPGGVDGTAR